MASFVPFLEQIKDDKIQIVIILMIFYAYLIHMMQYDHFWMGVHDLSGIQCGCKVSDLI